MTPHGLSLQARGSEEKSFKMEKISNHRFLEVPRALARLTTATHEPLRCQAEFDAWMGTMRQDGQAIPSHEECVW